jgi:hypothetical protein
MIDSADKELFKEYVGEIHESIYNLETIYTADDDTADTIIVAINLGPRDDTWLHQATEQLFGKWSPFHGRD